MSSPMTRGQLKQRALEQGDFLNSQYIDQTPGGELERYVDSELRNLWNLLMQTDETMVERGPFYLSTQAYQRTYMLPRDFFKLTAAYYVVNNAAQPNLPAQANNGRRFPLRNLTRAEYGANANYYNWGPPPIFYRLTGPQEMLFDPMPTQTQQNIVEYWYVPSYTPPGNDNEPIDQFVIPGWEDYVVWGTVIRMRTKEGAEDVSNLVAMREAFEQKLISQAEDRDRMNPHRIEDRGWDESGTGYAGGWGFQGFYGTW